MNEDPQKRALELGHYIAESGATVRCAARKFGISKSTVHTDVAKRKGVGGRVWIWKRTSARQMSLIVIDSTNS